MTPHSRLVWTNEEGDNGKTVTTVTFDDNAGKTLLVVHDRYPSKEALDSGSTGAMPEALDQLDELLASLGSSDGDKMTQPIHHTNASANERDEEH